MRSARAESSAEVSVLSKLKRLSACAMTALLCCAVPATVAHFAQRAIAATPCSGATRLVAVATAAELSHALGAARPGDGIRLASGRYDGQFTLRRSGTAGSPIVVCGPADAVLDGGTLDHGYGLHLEDSAYTVIRGITVRNAAKGIVTDRWRHGSIIDVTVTHIGQEGIHLRTFSSDDRVSSSRVSYTGLSSVSDSVHFGEGIYVGSAWENWRTYTDGRPDRCDRDRITGNAIAHTTAESIDVKEGTTGGLISGNTFDGSGMQDPDGADSWLDVKGNDWRITKNTGMHSPEDGFQVHVKKAGWGRGNIFAGNNIRLDHEGYGIFVAGNAPHNTVECSNTIRGSDLLITNATTDCRRHASNASTSEKPGNSTWLFVLAGVVVLALLAGGIQVRRRLRAR